MLKNYNKEGQQLPLFGIGPYLVYGIGLVSVAGIILFHYVFKIGILEGIWTFLFRMAGIILIISGSIVWYIGAVLSGMDERIENNSLNTSGIYSWVRNERY